MTPACLSSKCVFIIGKDEQSKRLVKRLNLIEAYVASLISQVAEQKRILDTYCEGEEVSLFSSSGSYQACELIPEDVVPNVTYLVNVNQLDNDVYEAIRLLEEEACALKLRIELFSLENQLEEIDTPSLSFVSSSSTSFSSSSSSSSSSSDSGISSGSLDDDHWEDDESIPFQLQINGITDPADSDPLIVSRVGDRNGYPSWSVSVGLLTFSLYWDGGFWYVEEVTTFSYAAFFESNVTIPLLLTFDEPTTGSGVVNITEVAPPSSSEESSSS